MNSLTESAVLERLPAAFHGASLDLASGLHRRLVLEEIDGLDSVSCVQLMFSVEGAFGIEISPRQNSRLRTIGDLMDLAPAKIAIAGRRG